MSDEQVTTHWYRVVGRSFVATVGTDDDYVITTTSPILRKFRGQRLFQLRRWKQVERIERMGPETGKEGTE